MISMTDVKDMWEDEFGGVYPLGSITPGKPEPLINNWVHPMKEQTQYAQIQKANAGGTKHDQEKPRMDLLDPEFLEGVASVLTFGAKKYSANNWRSGISYSRLIAAAYRHLGAIQKGEDTDGESSLPHVYHLACCIQFLSWMMQHRPDLDDRYKGA